ncbi:hypothetical protein O181_083099 [Austropuccinia psidii MF-1]|uniref:Uncharacterized protein n=1 Tax=Austropuccinia psidii MF-1 TaxID=1389203 RepID=A0A9Q3ILK2_9BASI|nr:hypothetical protein [Austropuccinia psidii MF-1]
MGDLSILNINDQLRTLKVHVLEIINNNNEFVTHLAKSDSERQKLKNEIILNVKTIHDNYEPHIPRHYTPLTEEKPSLKGSLNPFSGESPISAKDIPNWKNCKHSVVKENTIMLTSSEKLPDEILVGKLHSLVTRTAKKLY